MTRFVLEIEVPGEDQFEHKFYAAEMLSKINRKLSDMRSKGLIADINGNTVGYFKFDDQEVTENPF